MERPLDLPRDRPLGLLLDRPRDRSEDEVVLLRGRLEELCRDLVDCEFELEAARPAAASAASTEDPPDCSSILCPDLSEER